MPMTTIASDRYTGSVAKLLSLGSPEPFSARQGEWHDYRALGLTEYHTPELIQMATDEALNLAPGDDDAAWAPLHAWRALGQLQATEATEALLWLAEQQVDDDWLEDELPIVFSMLGASVLSNLQGFLANSNRVLEARLTITSALSRLGEDHPDLRDSCRSVLREQLAEHAQQSPDLNAFIVSALIDLGAEEDIDGIREAFGAGHVDLSVAGDIEDVELDLGLRTRRSTDRPPYFLHAAETAAPPPGLLSNFVKQLSRHEQQPQQGKAKIGRNESCPCGSGKKYKRCCGYR